MAVVAVTWQRWGEREVDAPHRSIRRECSKGRPDYIEVQGASRQPGEWFLCERPEAPFDNKATVHDCCRLCLIGAEAGHRRDGFPSERLVQQMRDRLHTHGAAPRLEAAS